MEKRRYGEEERVSMVNEGDRKDDKEGKEERARMVNEGDRMDGKEGEGERVRMIDREKEGWLEDKLKESDDDE